MRKRGRVDAIQGAVVAALRGAGASVLSLAPMGSGVPDLAVGYCDRAGVRRTVLMEVKSGASGTLTDDQVRWLADWRGGPVAVVRSVEQALEVIGVVVTTDLRREA